MPNLKLEGLKCLLVKPKRPNPLMYDDLKYPRSTLSAHLSMESGHRRPGDLRLRRRNQVTVVRHRRDAHAPPMIRR